MYTFVFGLHLYILYARTVGLPSPVTQLSLKSVKCRTATLTWHSLAFHDEACGAASFKISIVRINPPADGVVKTVDRFGLLYYRMSSLISYFASDLNPSSKYSVTVTTTNRLGDAPPSTPLIFTTMDELSYISPNGKFKAF